jgi:hypothetical protein
MTKDAATPKARKARSSKGDAARNKASKFVNSLIQTQRKLAALSPSLNEEQRSTIFSVLDAELEKTFAILQNPPAPAPPEAEFVLPA